MSKDIIIKIDDLEIKAKLNNSKTAKDIYNQLPIKSRVNTWGDEIYFSIPVMADLEQRFAKDIVELGDVGYWPQGAAFCIFFGLTPISRPGEIKPATTVNVIGKILGNLEVFRKIKNGQTVTLLKES
jgi:hypothetical protein